jgi:hypothetical protein
MRGALNKEHKAPLHIHYMRCAFHSGVGFQFRREQRRVILFRAGKDKRDCAGHKQLRSQREHRLTGGIG